MKKFFNIAGVTALLLLVYSALQGLFTALLMAVFVVYATIKGEVDLKNLPDITSVSRITDIPVLGNYIVEVMAWGLFLSVVSMILFLHLTKFFRLRKSILNSISFRPLLVSTLLVFTSMFALNLFVQFFPLEDMLENEFMGLTHNAIGALSISILGPVLEEMMFRGAIQGYMMRRVRYPWVAIIAASLLFGVFHMNPVQIVYATLLGVVFGWIYYRTGSLLSVIVGHVLNNSIATFTMLLFGDSSESEIIEGISPFAEHVLTAMLFVVFSAVSIVLAVKLHRMLPAPPNPWHESDEKPEPVTEEVANKEL